MTEKNRSKRLKSAPAAAWDWRARHLPGASFATLVMVEKAFVAGVRWAKRRKS